MITLGRSRSGSLAEGAGQDAMLVEVRAEQCNAESIESMQSKTGIKKPQYIQSRNQWRHRVALYVVR